LSYFITFLSFCREEKLNKSEKNLKNFCELSKVFPKTKLFAAVAGLN